jgi:hypothetical protein
MDEKLESAESAVNEDDAPGTDELQGDAGGGPLAAESGDNEPVAGADPPIIVQGGGKTGGIG